MPPNQPPNVDYGIGLCLPCLREMSVAQASGKPYQPPSFAATLAPLIVQSPVGASIVAVPQCIAHATQDAGKAPRRPLLIGAALPGRG